MVSFFQLELDTTAPALEIFSPTTASASTRTRIRIQADEELANYQNIYAEDMSGNRQKLHLLYHNTYFESDVIFQYDNQIITIAAQLQDTVGNISDLVTKQIRVLNGKPLNLITGEKVRIANERLWARAVQERELERKTNEQIQTNSQKTSDSVRVVKDSFGNPPSRNPYS